VAVEAAERLERIREQLATTSTIGACRSPRRVRSGHQATGCESPRRSSHRRVQREPPCVVFVTIVHGRRDVASIALRLADCAEDVRQALLDAAA
jgi:hypothetical protein